MKFSEIEKHLQFGNRLGKVKLELYAFDTKPDQYSYPEQSLKGLHSNIIIKYKTSIPIEKVLSKSSYYPERIISELRKSSGLSEEAGLLIFLGCRIGIWWQLKHHGEILADLNRSNQRVIEDINCGEKFGINVKLYEIIEKYSHIEFSQEKTFDLFREIALTYSNYTQFPQPLAQISQPEKSIPITVLFLAANPIETTNLDLNEEFNAIEYEIDSSKFRDKFNLEQRFALRADEISKQLLKYNPQVVHFSGHGSAAGEIVLQDDHGNAQPVDASAIARLFSILKDNIRCVVLNACYSKDQAMLISKYIDCVIGMSTGVGADAAIKFAQGFYRGLGFGKDLETAFNLGCAQIDLEDFDEEDTPKIIWKNNEPKKIVLTDIQK